MSIDVNSHEAREKLAAEDAEFRKMHLEHQGFEQRLNELQHKFGLSAEEEVEEKRLKKQKLHLRDLMEAYIRSHQTAAH
jgi:uncharacterized protein